MIRDSVLTLIRQYGQGISYPSILAHLKLERAALDPVLQGLVAERQIRYTRTGYVAVDEAKEAATYGTAKPMKAAKLRVTRTYICIVCGKQKSSGDFYGTSRECKGCATHRSGRNRRLRGKAMQHIIDGLGRIASSSPGCACCRTHQEIAQGLLTDIEHA